MRVYISVDMEGIAGVVHESQTDPTTPAFAAEYALAAGATRVLVNDSHWFMRNLLAEELHQTAELISGDPKPRSMMQGIDQQGGLRRGAVHRLPRPRRHPQRDPRPHVRRPHSRRASQQAAGWRAGAERRAGGRAWRPRRSGER